MSEELTRVIIPAIIALLIIWLIYRIKNRISLTIRNEIYSNFPDIKNTIDNFQRRMDFLISQAAILENKIKEMEKKCNTNKL